MHLVDTQNLLKEQISLASFTAGFKLAWGLTGDGMVRKREDGRWEGRIVIGHKENGEPIFRYVSAKTQRELLRKLHQSIEEYAVPSVRPFTLEGCRGYIERNIKPYLGDKAGKSHCPKSYGGDHPAAKIDRGLGNEGAEDSSEANLLTDFQPVMRRTRKAGTGCITEINDHLFEGRYSPAWADSTKHSKCVYAHTSEETIYSVIAKGAKVTRHTVARHYEMIQKMLGIQETAPRPLLNCQTVPLVV